MTARQWCASASDELTHRRILRAAVSRARLRFATVVLVTPALSLSGCPATEPRHETTASPSEVEERASGPRPSVVVVSADALRRDALGTHGASRPTSPRIDAFAQGAIVFDNAYTVAPVTPTSFAAAFTGLYSPRVFKNWRLESTVTLASVFREAGYQTAGFMNNPQLDPERGFGRGFDTYEAPANASDRAILGRALDWIERHRAAPQPFLVWLHLIDPHTPWDRNDAAGAFFDENYSGKYARHAAGRWRVEGPSEVVQLRRLYDGEVLAVDLLFGELLDRLEALGLREETVIVFTSDHGEEFMEHGRLLHGQLTEENVAIPLMLWHPGLGGGRRVSSRASNLDLLPTLAGLAGIVLETATDGRDLLSQPLPPTTPLLGISNTGNRNQSASIRRGDLKLIVRCGFFTSRELYDLAEDPGERHNLLLDRLDTADALEAALWENVGIAGCAELKMVRRLETNRVTHDLSRETIGALKKLGYLDDPANETP